METDDRLVLWAMAQREAGRINFSIRRLTWTDSIAPSVFDFEVHLKLKSETFIGRGTGSTANNAINAALGEALERTIAARLPSGSNGLAVHTDLSKAQDAARRELIERDGFLLSYLYGLPLKRSRMVSENLKTAISYLQQNGIEIDLYQIARSHGYFLTLAILWGHKSTPKFGMNIGLGCESGAKDSADKAVLEVLRNGAWALCSGHELNPMSFEEFKNLPRVRARDHLALALNAEFAADQREIWNSRRLVNQDYFLPATTSFIFENLKFVAELSEPPLYCVRASNLELQELYWGVDHAKYVNHSRGRNLGRKWIHNLPPHPMG